MKRWLIWGSVALVAVLVVGSAGFLLSPAGRRWLDDPASAAPVEGVTEVLVADDGFAPSVIEVPAGTTVTWRWVDEQPHDLRGPGFGVDARSTGTYEHVFDVPGAYRYVCTLHFRMNGRVVVTPS